MEVENAPRQQPKTLAASPAQAQQCQSHIAQVEALVHEIEEISGTIEDKYNFVEEITRGSMSQIFAATLIEDSTQRRAIKRVTQENVEEHLLFREVILLKQLRHPHIACFYDVFDAPDFLDIVMEICDGVTLFQRILETRRFSETDSAQFGGHMLLALKYIHSRYIVHRDVKAENFMLATPHPPSHLKLVDFFLACKFTPGRLMTEVCGSPNYLAPELIGQRYTSPVDMWAFGVLQFLLMHGHYPWNGERSYDIIKNITHAPRLWQAQAVVSDTCMDFLKGVLAVCASSRFSAQEALEHVWMHATDYDSPSGSSDEDPVDLP